MLVDRGLGDPGAVRPALVDRVLDDRVPTPAAVDEVALAVLRVDPVVARSPVEDVLSLAPDDGVRAGTAVEGIVAVIAVEAVGPRKADDVVGVRPSRGSCQALPLPGSPARRARVIAGGDDH